MKKVESSDGVNALGVVTAPPAPAPAPAPAPEPVVEDSDLQVRAVGTVTPPDDAPDVDDGEGDPEVE
jgi:hypothetical protein